MPNTPCTYVRIIHRGRGYNVRVLLPNGDTPLISRTELANWTQVPPNEDTPEYVCTRRRNRINNSVNNSVNNSDNDRKYVAILEHIRGRSNNIRLLLPDGNTVIIPSTELGNWTCVLPNVRTNAETHFINDKTIDDITFGVELEFIADALRYNDFIYEMNRLLGNRFDDPMCYHIHSTTKWLLKTDSSVQNKSRNTPTYRGYELTSPILKLNNESREELSKVLNIITTVFKGTINVSCGTHVHIGNFTNIPPQNNVSAFSKFKEACKKFQVNYGVYEASVFDRVTSPSRRASFNQYCKSCYRDHGYCDDDRYYKMNILNAINPDGFGTLENRQHNGTLELKKIWYWVELNARYMLKFFKNPSKFEYSPFETNDLISFFEKIELSPEAQAFYLAREAELN